MFSLFVFFFWLLLLRVLHAFCSHTLPCELQWHRWHYAVCSTRFFAYLSASQQAIGMQPCSPSYYKRARGTNATREHRNVNRFNRLCGCSVVHSSTLIVFELFGIESAAASSGAIDCGIGQLSAARSIVTPSTEPGNYFLYIYMYMYIQYTY